MQFAEGFFQTGLPWRLAVHLPAHTKNPVSQATPVSELQPINGSFKSFLESNGILEKGGCSRCFVFNHMRSSCRLQIRCVACFKSGHTYRFYLTKSRPKIYWRPKVVVLVCQPSSESNKSSSDIGPSPKGEEAPFPSDETEVHSISSPNRLTSKKPHSPSEQELLFTSPPPFSLLWCLIKARATWITLKRTQFLSSRRE